MKDGFIRVGAATPEIRVADCDYNAEQIISLINEAYEKDVSVLVFPELCITGATCGDLFLQKALLDGAEKALDKILEATKDIDMLIVVGMPIADDGRLYNCGVHIQNGRAVNAYPKIHVSKNNDEYRYFMPWTGGINRLDIGGENIGIGTDEIYCTNIPKLSLYIEMGEDLYSFDNPMGATVILNPCAVPEIVGAAEYRRLMTRSQSARLNCGIVCAGAGKGESTTDHVYGGHNIIAENGKILTESKRFTTGLIYTEVDVQMISSERRKPVSLRGRDDETFFIAVDELKEKDITLTRKISPMPFIPENEEELASRCEEILAIQAEGLASRLRHISCKTAVLGLSGGLDSTLALIVTARAFDILGLDRKGILTITMPCFGTTSRTKNNAIELSKAYDTDFKEINIAKSVEQHFIDIGQKPEVHDVTYENAQARERTQVLMDTANQLGGIVIGTGDLSELALGWATYNGDQMSMYSVNASVPKTLVRHLVAYEAKMSGGIKKQVLEDVLNTPVSPELLPPKDGEISQKTEELVGPYELHDFFLYYFVKYGFSPKKILRLAKAAFAGAYDDETILKWLKKFIWRFFSQQFKRSCMPDGPAVGSVTLSPRGGYVMPSDASCNLWIKELEDL